MACPVSACDHPTGYLSPDRLPVHRESRRLFPLLRHFPSSAVLITGFLVLSIPSSVLAWQDLSFNRDIRPILAENCYYCHGQDANHRQADLRLDQAESALELGAIVPGDPDSSTLIQRVMESDPDLQMPPANSNRHLSDAQKELLRKWVQQGADYETHWAFTRPQRPAVPQVSDPAWCRNEIDYFVMAQLDAQGMKPSSQADPATLIKRLYADLVGLPPEPAAVRAFVDAPDPDAAYHQLVEDLLASPHYGERMALPWLDAARYSDSNGFQQDGDHWQWIWRDHLVQSLNRDQPFDEFTIWQLAGDLLPDATEEQKIASGFNRNHMLNGEGGAIAEEQRWVNLFDRVDTTATTWLGLTMACGQCHDHKYDPITQTEYYQFLDAFNRVPERGVPRFFSSRIRIDDPFLELPTKENQQQIAQREATLKHHQDVLDQATHNAFLGWQAAIPQAGDNALQHPAFANAEDAIKQILAVADDQRSDEQKQNLRHYLRQYFDKEIVPGLNQLSGLAERNQVRDQLNQYRADQIPRVMIMSDANPRKTHRLDRGQYLSPLEEVTFGTPQFLPPMDPQWPANRLGLARWLVSDQHPLTSRVQVNRMWQHFFGQGFVKTSEDFGVQSQYPVHLDLLNWLSVQFREGGWSVKDIHRRILHSATYRQTSRIDPEAWQRDPENLYFGRAGRFRMPAMVLRDWALAASGLLNAKVGGAPVYPYQPDQVWESLAITKERDFTYPESVGEDLYRRSLYTFWRRTVGPANMFDSSNRQTCRVRSPVTSTPLHALTMLNDPTWVEAARHLAGECLPMGDHLPVSPESVDPETHLAQQMLDQAFWRIVCRAPSPEERQRLTLRYRQWLSQFQNDPQAAEALLETGQSRPIEGLNPARHAAMTVSCLTIMNLDEAMTRE